MPGRASDEFTVWWENFHSEYIEPGSRDEYLKGNEV